MNSVQVKPKDNDTITDSIIYVLFIAVLACRLFVNEVFPGASPLVGENNGGGIVGFGGLSFMLSFDILLLLGSGLWLVLKLKAGDLLWRKTEMVIPALLLLVATILSYWSASDKSVGLVSGLNLLSMMVAGLVMVQLLVVPSRRKLLLAVVLALGICQMWRCYEQQSEHEVTIGQMEADYDGFMSGQGLNPDSWQARQMEERVRSRDTGGYFSISNTAASYFLLTLACASCVAGAGGWRKGQVPILPVAGIVLAAVMTLGIKITDSTGGKLCTAAMFAAIFGLVILRNVRYRKIMFVLFVLAIAGGTASVVCYGQVHDRLPTSNLWIRWQYWQATAKMIADHWLAGVGPFNFDHYYGLYMNPTSPEVVKDPHCVPLAIFSQWGVFGIAAMVWSVLGVLWMLVSPVKERAASPGQESNYSILKVSITAVVLSLSIFLIRMISVDDSLNEIPLVAKMYLTLEPAIKFGVIFFLLGYLFLCREEIKPVVHGRKVLIPLLAGLAAFSLHNTIDFAFFQPGVGMLFFFLAALAISAKEPEVIVVRRKPMYLYASMAAVLLILMVAILPGFGGGIYRTDKAVSRAEKYVTMAGRMRQLKRAEQAIEICMNNADSSPNDARTLYYAARLCNQLWHYSDFKEGSYFDLAISALDRASERDPSHFRYDKLRGELYVNNGKRFKAGSDDREFNYVKAVQNFDKYLEKYPGNSDVLAMLADVKFDLGSKQEAGRLALKAIEIEQGCMELQPKLFPHREVYYPRMDQELEERAEEILQLVDVGDE